MPVVKFSLSEEHFKRLAEMAAQDSVPVQDYIRNKLFGVTSIFTPIEAVDRAVKKYGTGELFTLPELYDDEWTIQRGVAGVFGKQFFNYITSECPGRIEFVGMTDYGRRAQYKRL